MISVYEGLILDIHSAFTKPPSSLFGLC